MSSNRILARITQLLAVEWPAQDERGYVVIAEGLQSALVLIRTLYGQGSPSEDLLLKARDAAHRGPTSDIAFNYPKVVWPAVRGVLAGLKADVEAGLVTSIERRGMGEVLADMLALAKEANSDGSDGAKNVASVLAAAAYEDTMRKMGATFAGVHDRPELSKVLLALKTAKILEGAPYTTAQGYLKFRNDALHADWAKIDHATVSSCVSFVEGQLLKHFA